ncbi:MAG: Ig-like domain-containing protein [Pirellulaceae bacterium]
MEQLEDRRLLAADFPLYNALVSVDASHDGVASSVNALAIIDQVNQSGSIKLDANTTSVANVTSVGASQDNVLSPLDALRVISELNSGEGELTDPQYVKFDLELQNSSGVKIEPLKNSSGVVQTDAAGDPIYRVRVGDYFRVQVFVDDLRSTAIDPGVFSAALDVAYSDPALFSMNGTKPDAFSDLTQFQSFFNGSAYYANLDVRPAADNFDGDQVPNEFDEIMALNDWFSAPPAQKLPATLARLPLVYVTLKADAAGKLTFQANQSDQGSPASDVLILPDDPAADLVVPVGSIDFGFPLHVTIERQVDAKDDAYTVSEEVPSTLDVLLNDTLETLSTGTKRLLPASQTATDLKPAHGTAVISNGKVSYTSTKDYVGTDTFTYTVIDNLGNSDVATVTVTVTDVNDAPKTTSDSATVVEDIALAISVLANDNGGPANENQALTIAVGSLAQPLHGTATLNAEKTQVIYTPTPDYFGQDSFQYRAADSGLATSDLTTVSITVTPVNDAPVAGADMATVERDRGAAITVDVLANDSPGPGETLVDALTIVSVQGFSHGGSATISGTSVLYQPAGDFFGEETFTYTIRDNTTQVNGGLTTTGTVKIYNVFTNSAQNTLYRGDFNGDGYSDIAIATSQENNNGIDGDNDLSWYTILGSASGLSGPKRWSTINGFAGESFYVADFNGDGQDDVLSSTTRINGNGISGDNDLAWYFIRSTGTGFISEVQLNSSYGINSDKYYVSDFNGDAKDDILISTTRVNVNGIVGDNDLAWYLMRSNGSTFLDGGRINGSYGLDVDKYYVSDFNGDGKDDMLISTTRINYNGLPDNDLAWYLMRSNGSTFLDGGRINNSYGLDSDKYYVADLSGDGKDDMVISTIRVNGNGIVGDNDLAWYLMRSTGSTFVDGGQSSSSYGRDGDLYFPFKLNIDAKEDLVMIVPSVQGSGDYSVYGALSNGTKYTDDGKKF